MLRKYTLATLMALILQSALFGQTQIGQTLLNTADGDRFGSCLALSDDGNLLVAGTPGLDLFGTFGVGKVEVFQFNGTQWVQLGQTIEGEDLQFGQLGRGVDISPDGTRIAAGNNNTNAKVFEWNAIPGMWEQMGSDLEFPSSPDADITSFRFSSDGNTLVTGGSGGGDSVVRYLWDGSNWSQQGSALTTPDRRYIAISDDASRVAVQFYGESEGINIYDFDGSNWTLIETIMAPAEYFIGDGFDLSADGDRLVYGIVDDSGNPVDGLILTKENVGGNWIETLPQIPVLMTSWSYGLRVSDDGTKFIFGSGEENTPLTDMDGAFVYEEVNGSWLLLHQFAYDNYDESINGNVDITPDGNIVAFGKSIPFAEGFIQVYDISDLQVSVEESLVSANPVSVFPNPSNGQFNVQLNKPEPEVFIIITNAMGRVVHNQRFQNIQEIPLEIKGASDVYQVTITGRSFSFTERVITVD